MEKQCLLKMPLMQARAAGCQRWKGHAFPPRPRLREAPNPARVHARSKWPPGATSGLLSVPPGPAGV